ncbi:MAG TPA: cyanophycin synthetase, partial [Anaerolineales bacterium]
GQSFRITDQNGSRDFIIPLLGSHQLTNAATAYGALAASELDVPNVAIGEGFSRAKWPGRFEILRREPPFIIDSAHNRESALRLYEALRDYFPERRVVMVFCALEDKDIPGILAELAPCLERVVATRADHPRAASAEWIAERVSEAGIPVETAEPAAQALRRAFEIAGDRSPVLAAGSVAFAGEIRQAWLDMQQASR